MAKIIIIGAGIAGLTAAYELAIKNHEVILLEARNRIGGRIYTAKASDHVTPIELGASYWEGKNTHPLYQQYFDKSDIRKPFTKLCNGDPIILEPLDSLSSSHNRESSAHYQKIARDHLEQSNKTCVYKTAQQRVEDCDFSRLDKSSIYWVKKWMELQLIHQSTCLSKVGYPSYEIPPDPEDLNATSEEANYCFVGNGYDKLVSQITELCINAHVKIITNNPVKKVVDKCKKGLSIYTASQEFTADKVVCTIPIGVLKTEAKSLFSPGLSEEKLQAISDIGIHESTRVVLEFDFPFWGESDAPYLLLSSPHKPGMKEFRNNSLLHGKAILQTPNYAKEAKGISDIALIELIMSDLRMAFKQQHIPDPIYYQVYRWTDDPYAQGSYPYHTLKMNEKGFQALERAEGNIYFAGSDFSRFGYLVHHAYNSGKQVAGEIMKLYE